MYTGSVGSSPYLASVVQPKKPMYFDDYVENYGKAEFDKLLENAWYSNCTLSFEEFIGHIKEKIEEKGLEEYRGELQSNRRNGPLQIDAMAYNFLLAARGAASDKGVELQYRPY